MPRYVYRCDSCDDHFQIRHGMKETQESCQLCQKSGSLTRVPQMPSVKKEIKSTNQKTGNLTNDFIEQNRELLSEMKKEARNNEYDN